MTPIKTLVSSIAMTSLALCCQCGGDDRASPRPEAGSESESGGTVDAGLESSSDASLDADAAESVGADGPFASAFFLGADITFTQQDEANGATFSDNGTPKPILQLLKDHGFNYIRLRTFVDPTQRAPNPQGGTFPPYSPQGFGDLAHTVAFGRQIKAAGMGFLLDFHYSDYWADPGKQIKPATWANDSLAAAVTDLHDYTLADLQTLIGAGARPDMVQIGNEITPGILLSPGTGLGPRSPRGWPALAQLLVAGVKAVHEADAAIKIMLHLDRGGDLASSIDFIDNAVANGVEFDVFGESCYVSYQGPPSSWQNTFNGLVSRYPNLKFVMAEYNADPADPTGPELRQANDIVFKLPNHQGLGTFFWEPTRYINPANPGMFMVNGSVYSPVPASIARYDQMAVDYGL
jgi:arabinogalactan endo-1,4-beta-galactosidase